MNKKDHIKNLMLKFARNRCNQAEINELVHYFSENPEENVLPEAKEVLQHTDMESGTYREPAEDLFAEIKKKIQNNKLQQLGSRHKKRKFWYGAVAAVFVAILSGSLYFDLIENTFWALVNAGGAIIIERENGSDFGKRLTSANR